MQFGVLLPQPPELSPNAGGGPLLRTPLVALPANASTMVYRTPHAVVAEPHPEAIFPGLSNKKFLPDGRLVDKGALGFSPGQAAQAFLDQSNTLMWIGLLGGAAVGAVAGLLRNPQCVAPRARLRSRATAGMIGGGAGAAGGVLVAVIAQRAAEVGALHVKMLEE